MAKKPLLKKPVAKKTGIKKKPVAKKTAGTIVRLDELTPYPYLIKPVSGTRIDAYAVTYWTDTPGITLFGNRQVIASIRFQDADPWPSFLRDDQAWMFFRRAAFADVLDLLRNESPLYLIHRGGPDNYRIAISTLDDRYVLNVEDLEPVGEGE